MTQEDSRSVRNVKFLLFRSNLIIYLLEGGYRAAASDANSVNHKSLGRQQTVAVPGFLKLNIALDGEISLSSTLLHVDSWTRPGSQDNGGRGNSHQVNGNYDICITQENSNLRIE